MREAHSRAGWKSVETSVRSLVRFLQPCQCLSYSAQAGGERVMLQTLGTKENGGETPLLRQNVDMVICMNVNPSASFPSAPRTLTATHMLLMRKLEEPSLKKLNDL